MQGDCHEVHVVRTCTWEDVGEGMAMDPHASMVQWWRGEVGMVRAKTWAERAKSVAWEWA